MTFNRRQFFLGSLSTFILSPFLFISGSAKASYGDIVVGGGMYKDLNTNKINYLLGYVDLGKYTTKQISLNFLPHGIALDPNNSNRLFAFEKIGPGACVVDLENFSLEQYIEPIDGCYFYGHGMPSKDGLVTYQTETDIITKKGYIPIRDTNTLQVLDYFPTYGEKPHDCHLIENGKVMAITNGGSAIGRDEEKPSVTFVEIASRKLLEKIELDNHAFNTGHLAYQDGDLVVVSAPREGLSKMNLGAVSIRKKNDSIKTMTNPEPITSQIFGEALSVAIEPKQRIAAVTHPTGNLVTFWSIENNSLLNALSLPHARGVVLNTDGKSFIITYGKEASLIEVDINTLTPINDSVIQSTFISGSHLYNISRERILLKLI